MIDTQPPPQTCAARNANGEGVVVCYLHLPAPVLEMFFPPANYIGLLMLAKSLDDAAQADGRCSSSAVVPCGELNRGWIMGIYEQPAQAAQSWLTAIRRFKFTNYTGLAWLGWRDAEGLWHKIWPESWPLDVDFNLLVSDAALQAIHDHWLALQEQMQQALRAAELADVLNGQS